MRGGIDAWTDAWMGTAADTGLDWGMHRPNYVVAIGDEFKCAIFKMFGPADKTGHAETFLQITFKIIAEVPTKRRHMTQGILKIIQTYINTVKTAPLSRYHCSTNCMPP